MASNYMGSRETQDLNFMGTNQATDSLAKSSFAVG